MEIINQFRGLNAPRATASFDAAGAGRGDCVVGVDLCEGAGAENQGPGRVGEGCCAGVEGLVEGGFEGGVPFDLKGSDGIGDGDDGGDVGFAGWPVGVCV